MFLVGMGSGAQICLQPVANLFEPNVQGKILSTLSGAFQISGLVFLVLTSIGGHSGGNGNGDGLKISFGVFGGILMTLAGIAMVVLPRKHFTRRVGLMGVDTVEGVAIMDDDDKMEEIVEKEHILCSDNGISGDVSAVDIGNGGTALEVVGAQTGNTCSPIVFVESNDGTDNGTSHVLEVITKPSFNTPIGDGANDDDDINISSSLMNQLKTAEYIWLVIWFSTIIIPLQYYVATLGYHMEQKGDADGRYTNFFPIIYASSAIASPFIGKIIDLYGLGVSQGVATGLCTVSLFIMSSDSISLKAQVVGMVFYGTGRMMVFASLFSNVGKRFGYWNYGTLCGFALLVSGIVSLLQYPMIAAVTSTSDGSDGRNNSQIVNVGCGIGMIILLPYCIWLGLREKRGQCAC